MSTSDTAPATGIVGATQSFEAFLAAEDAGTGTPEPTRAAPSNAEADEADALLAEMDRDETPPESSEEGAEGDPEVEAADESEGSENAEPEVQLVTVTVNGKSEQIPLEEAVKGYQRQADYSQKTAALAEDKRSFEAERQQVAQERAQYGQLLTALSQQLQQAQPQEPDWERLYQADPLEYVRQKDLYRERQDKLAAAQFEMQRVQALQMQEAQQTLGQSVQAARQKLLEAVPAWKDTQKWEFDRAKLLEYGRKIGYSDDELGQAYDHRAIVIMDKARKYDDLLAKRPQAVQPKGPKTSNAGSAANAPRQMNDVSKAKQRLAKTGKVADAAYLFEGLLD
jgi:hypothetical protein